MVNLDRICIGIDFTEGSDRALRSSAVLAKRYGASLDLVHVIHPPPIYPLAIPADADHADIDSAVEHAQHRLEQIVAGPLAGGVSATCSVRIGAPFVEVITHARERADDLIAVGDFASGQPPPFLGGTSERIVRKALVPVLVAKRSLERLPATILAPTDFSEASLPALQQAAMLARQWGARLLIAHAIEPTTHLYGWGAELAGGDVSGGDVYCVEPEALEPEWRAVLDSISLANIRWEQLCVKGPPAEALAGLADERHIDLIVLGTHGRSALPHALLGSVAEAVIRRARCCVMSVRHDAFTFRLP